MTFNILRFKNFTRWGKLAIIIVIAVIIMGIFAPFIAPYGPDTPLSKALLTPSREHILGTDDLGYDLLSQIIYGARISIIIGFSTAILAGIGGGILGVLAGYYGGSLDKFIMRIVDMIIALPDLPVMILLGAFFGSSLRNIVLVLALFSWTTPARIIRSRVLSLKEEAYVLAAKSYGAGFWHLFRTHFLPEILPILSITSIRIVSKAIVAEASLAFLGLGDPTSKSWGLILNHAINFKGIYYTDYWKWWIMSPLLATMILILSISYISKDLERISNEKLKGGGI